MGLRTGRAVATQGLPSGRSFAGGAGIARGRALAMRSRRQGPWWRAEASDKGPRVAKHGRSGNRKLALSVAWIKSSRYHVERPTCATERAARSRADCGRVLHWWCREPALRGDLIPAFPAWCGAAGTQLTAVDVYRYRGGR